MGVGKKDMKWKGEVAGFISLESNYKLLSCEKIREMCVKSKELSRVLLPLIY